MRIVLAVLVLLLLGALSTLAGLLAGYAWEKRRRKKQ
jgi:hypothetical protein